MLSALKVMEEVMKLLNNKQLLNQKTKFNPVTAQCYAFKNLLKLKFIWF